MSMIGYVTIGAADVEAAMPFYDALFGAMGGKRHWFSGGWAGYGGQEGDANVYVCPPFEGEARAGNGVMVALKAGSKDLVKAAHEAGLAAGGKDEGGPGPRPEDSTSFYGAYLRDPTGNKLCVYCAP